MKERIRAIRKSEKLTQEQFGECLGVGKFAVVKWERADTTPQPATIKLICSKFNISEEWLMNGIGEMYSPEHSEDEVLSGQLLDAYNNAPDIVRAIVDTYLQLPESSRKVMHSVLEEISNRMQNRVPEDDITPETIVERVITDRNKKQA